MATDRPSARRRRWLIGLAGAVILLVLIAGSLVLLRQEKNASAPPTGGTSTTGPTTTPLPVRSATSTAAPTLGPGDYTHSMTVGGQSRTFILHVPPAASTGKALPLVFVYHGALDTAANTQSETDFDGVADSRGMLVVFMQGYGNTWNEGAGHTPAEVAGIDDVAFTGAALSAIEGQVTVDKRKVAATGFSNGALLADLLGCRLAGSIHLIVPVEGPLPVTVSSGCTPAQPISVLEIHGTADSTIPYSGGSFAGVGGGTTVLSAPAAVARWAALDGCSAAPTTQTASSLKVTTYGGCSGGSEVSLQTLEGAGHDWPSDIGETVASALGLGG
jgi:polyhydroxybutyrate depolymerase